MSHKIHSANARAKMAPRREPYWGAPLDTGLYLGFRSSDIGAGTWLARQYHDKRQHFQALGSAAFVSYDDAKAAAVVFGESITAGVDVKAVKTVSDLCAAYVVDRGREKGAAVALEMTQRFARSLDKHTLGATKLDAFKEDDIKAWRDGLTREDGEPMSDSSKNRLYAGLVAALNFGIRKNFIHENRKREWRYIGRFKEHTESERYLSKAERATLLALVPDHLRPLLTMLALVPLRPSAAANLTVGAFNVHTNELRIAKDKTGPRTITVGAAAAAHIKAASKGKLPGALLFPAQGGGVMPRQTWGDAIRAAREPAGLPADTCAYSFRHSGMTDLLTAGVDSLTVSKLSGTSIVQIDRTYGHLVGHHAAKALDMLAG